MPLTELYEPMGLYLSDFIKRARTDAPYVRRDTEEPP